MNTNRMKEPCLYFTWVPIPASSPTAEQQRAAGNRAAGDGSAVVPGPSPLKTASNGPDDRAASANQGGACLLIGGGIGWVDAEASKPGSNTVSGLLYVG